MLVDGLKIRKIFATNSLPTIEVELRTKKGTVRSSVPMGTSVGRHEVVCLPVDDVIRKFALVSRQFRSGSFAGSFYTQEDVDTTLHLIDKTPNFKEIGGNLALGISSAFLKAFALEADLEVFEYVYGQITQMKNKNMAQQTAQKMSQQSKPITSVPTKMPMPIPICNMVGGWRSSSGAMQSDVQEFLLFPASQKSFLDSMTNLSEAYREIGRELERADKEFTYAKNIESAWMTRLGFESVLKVLSQVGGRRLLQIGMDFAASNLWDGKNYVYKNYGNENPENGNAGNKNDVKMIRTEQLDLLVSLARRFPIAYMEDPFEEDDFVSHATLTHILSNRGVLVCGDDLYATNLSLLQIGLGNKATNAVVVKPNQIGTITDTIKFVEEAKKNGLKTVMSHRSGETEDTLICHLAVGLGCDYIKLGISGERTAKINEMIRIEERLGQLS
jgi:enolase